MSGGQVVKVERQSIAACMTCPLCHNLYRDATTISECLHTFCRTCIYKKITDEDLGSCPVCDIGLGCAPLEKLRADHSLSDLRAKIFPSKRQNAREIEAVSSIPHVVPPVQEVAPAVPEAMLSDQEPEHPLPLLGRRKERSLSSLVVSTPKISVKSVLRGKRLKTLARTHPTLRESVVPVETPVKKVDDYYESLSSPAILSKFAQNQRQNSPTAEPSKQHTHNKEAEDGIELRRGKSYPWKPLNCLVNAASNTKSNNSSIRKILIRIKSHNAQEEEAQVLNEHGNEAKVNGAENSSTVSPSGSMKPRRLQGMRQKRAAPSEGLNVQAQAVADADSKCDRRYSPIWFSLVASDKQDGGGAPLPQISSCYLRVMDGRLPISYVKKYLAQKLGLVSEAELEISLRGQPVVCTLQMRHLVDWWLQTAPASERIQTTVGSSAKDFVMVLTYGRNAQPP